MTRENTRRVMCGGVAIGGGAPVSIQSMLNREAHDIEGGVAQAVALEQAGCQIIRAAVPDVQSAKLIEALKNAVSVPIVADIHFDYRIALECVAAGVDKIRINPCNIGERSRTEAVVKACAEKKIPIRIGVNSGSVEKDILAKYGSPTAEALVESALYHASILEELGFFDTVISIKSSTVQTTIEAYRLAAQRCSYPLHLGVTEAGTARMGLVKSAVGIGSLLCDGIGDTVRVSLTADPTQEIRAARDILKACGLRGGVEFVSCPTCGRTKIDVISIAEQVQSALETCPKNIKVAVMGCVVNGPGEAREADIGIAGGDGCAVIIKKGEIIRKIPEADIVRELLAEIDKM